MSHAEQTATVAAQSGPDAVVSTEDAAAMRLFKAVTDGDLDTVSGGHCTAAVAQVRGRFFSPPHTSMM